MDSRIYNTQRYKSSSQVLQNPEPRETKGGEVYEFTYGITGIIEKIIQEAQHFKKTNRLEILAKGKSVLNLSIDSDLAIFEDVANKHDERIYSWRKRSQKQLESVVYYVVEHYQESPFDICDIESKVMNWFWEGNEQEHIKGGRCVQDLRNVRLRNMLTRRLFNAIIESKDSEIDTRSCWYNNSRENIDGKQFCRFCKQWTSQYENTCPKCHGFPMKDKRRI